MNLTPEAQAAIAGAIAGGVFALFAAFAGALLRDRLDARRRRIEREEAQKEEQDKRTKDTMQYLQAAGMQINPEYDEDGEIVGIDLSKTEEERSE